MKESKIENLLNLIVSKNIIILEGAKNSGKSFLAQELAKSLGFPIYTPWKNRRTDQSFNTILKADLTQSSIWIFDFLMQMDNPKLIIDRSMLSSFLPKTEKYQFVVGNAQLKHQRASFYNKMMEELNGITVLVSSNRSNTSHESVLYGNICEYYKINYINYFNEITH